MTRTTNDQEMKNINEHHCVLLPNTPLQFIHCPMSDGGAGLLDSLTYHPTHNTNEVNKVQDTAERHTMANKVNKPDHK